MKLQVLDADYVIEDDEVEVRCYSKNAKGENILLRDESFKPYLYVVPEPNKTEEVKEEIENSDFSKDDEDLKILDVEKKVRKDVKEEIEVLKVSTTVPPNIPKLKDEFWDLPGVKECREFDIPFYKRYLIDSRVRPGSWIEVEGEKKSSEKFEGEIEVQKIEILEEDDTGLDYNWLAFDLEVYEDEIIMLSVYSNDFEKVYCTENIDKDFVEKVESERDILTKFVKLVEERDIDVLTGYNTDEFDFQVLRERAETHGVTLKLGRNGERMKFNRRGRFSGARLKGRMHLDLYPFISHVIAPGLDSETLDLDSVAEELLGENKDEMSWEEMKQSWQQKENLEKFADYALKDSKLAFKLAEELVPQMLELSRITGIIPFDACRLTYGQLTENFLIREAFKRNMLCQNRPSRSKRSDRRRQGAYSGGFVYTPEAGLYENIAVFDFKSLYPTVMVAHNISPDTLNLEKCKDRFQLEEFNYNFCQDSQGFFPELVEQLVEDRSKIKKEMAEVKESSQEYSSLDSRQKAEKILANSFYGYLGYEGARWYSRESAEATTFLGRKYIKETVEKAEKNGYEVVYGDTDSVLLKKENIRENMDEFLDEVNSELPEFMELEFEGFFQTGFFTSTDSGKGAKKKYALMDEDGNMKITGFEQVRRDWSPVAKRTQKEVLRKVLDQDIEGAYKVARKTIDDLKNDEVPVEDLKIYTTLTKKPENYDSTAPHVEAAKKAIECGENISAGQTISYVVTRGSGTISDRAEILKYAESYDSDYYVENQVVPAAIRVLKVFGYTADQLKGKGKQSGLGRFS